MTAYKLRCHKCDDADYPGARELCAHLYEKHGDLMDLTAEDEDTPWDAISQLRGADVLGDALLFSANAEIERLKAEVLRSDKAVEGAAAALEVCDVTLAAWANTLANHAGFEHRTVKDMDDLLTDMEGVQRDDWDEVERLKSRCCEECAHWVEGVQRTCNANVAVFPDETSQDYDEPPSDFACNRWAEIVS